MGRVLGVVVHAVLRGDFNGGQGRVLPGVAVDVEAGKVAGGDVQPDTVSLSEQVAGGIKANGDWIDFPRLQKFGFRP